jgi:hypothetical protein
MSAPDISTLAQASESAYSTVNTNPKNYSKVDRLSSADISTFKHDLDNHYIVAHRGTDLHSDQKTKQIKADLGILLGNRDQNKLHKQRTKETERIVKSIKETDPEHKVYLTGHSLGGSTAHHAMVKSPYVRENVTELHTFNAGSSPLQSKGLSPKNKAYSVIERKSTHHTIQGDAIAGSVKSNLIGTHKTYKNKQKPTVAQMVLNLSAPLLKSSPLGALAHFGASKIADTLSAHSLNNFIKK